MNIIHIPAERWEAYTASYSAASAVEHKGKPPVPVRTIEHGGFLYTSFAIHYGCLGDSTGPTVKAWRLLPLALYKGETTLKYHDEEAIESGRRNRGDMTGVVVSVRGSHMVCAEPVEFCMALPCTKPISKEEAEQHNESESKHGWRALMFKRAKVEWFTLHGHPVARYSKKDGECHAVLFWKKGSTIHEQWLDEDMPLAPLTERAYMERPAASADDRQLALFI